jgi:hypothetical protein
VSLGDAIELREDDTMKTLTTMMTLVASMILFSASASAQDGVYVSERYDYDTSRQNLAGVVGGAAGASLGALAGLSLAESVCSGWAWACLS